MYTQMGTSCPFRESADHARILQEGHGDKGDDHDADK